MIKVENHIHFSSVAEWLHYLENRNQQEINLNLANVKAVAKSMQLLQTNAKVIIIGGTNGKGSTVAALESIYLTAGYQVGCYTSPHLVNFNERIKINRQPISDKNLYAAFKQVLHKRIELPLTYFEVSTLAALWYFKQHQLDFIILEVGLGGRQDATNIIDADLAIITTIDLDHQEWLGETKEKIGYEKAGILRHQQPVIFADLIMPDSVWAEAHKLNCQIYCCGINYHYCLRQDYLQINFQDQVINLPLLNLHPNSIAAAVTAVIYWQNFYPVSFEQIVNGIKNIFLPGRLEIVQGKHITLFDVAHNEQAVSYLASYIKKVNCNYNAIHAIFSALKDKNIAGMIKLLRPYIDYWYPAQLTNKRACAGEQLLDIYQEQGIEVKLNLNPVLAYKEACQHASPNDLIIVFGSFFTVGAVMQYATT